MVKWRCKFCGCFWRKNGDGSWSLWDEHQECKQCCDNNVNFVAALEAIDDAES